MKKEKDLNQYIGSIGKAIQVLRKKCEVTQLDLAKKIGVSQSYLSLIEKDQREPGLELIKNIANALEIPQQLLYLMSCDQIKEKRYGKPLKNILKAVNEILATI